MIELVPGRGSAGGAGGIRRVDRRGSADDAGGSKGAKDPAIVAEATLFGS